MTLRERIEEQLVLWAGEIMDMEESHTSAVTRTMRTMINEVETILELDRAESRNG